MIFNRRQIELRYRQCSSKMCGHWLHSKEHGITSSEPCPVFDFSVIDIKCIHVYHRTLSHGVWFELHNLEIRDQSGALLSDGMRDGFI